MTSGPVARALGEADAVICYSRSAPLLEAVAARARRVIRQDPSPPATGPHAARWLAQAVAPLLGGRPAPLRDAGVLEFTEEEGRHAETATRELPEGFVAVHPGSGSPAKNWPWARFVDAARALAGGHRWLLVAGPAERGVDPPSDAVLARDWPLRLLGAALARALGAGRTPREDAPRARRIAPRSRSGDGARGRASRQVRGERTSIRLIRR
jgi:hypothetical protein